MLTFPAKPQRVQHVAGTALEWLSRCRRYRVTRLVEYPAQPYLLCVRDYMPDGFTPRWDLLSRHRKRAVAFRAASAHTKRETQAELFS